MRRVLVSERRETAVKRSPPMMPTALRRSNQFLRTQADMPQSYHDLGGAGKGSTLVGDVRFGEHKRFAGHPHHALIRAAEGMLFRQDRKSAAGKYREARPLPYRSYWQTISG